MDLRNKATAPWSNFFRLGMPQIRFGLGLSGAATSAALFGLMNIFARTLGGLLVCLFILGLIVVACSFCAFLVRFSTEAETVASDEYDAAISQQNPLALESLELNPALT